MGSDSRIAIHEVGPRDGLQNEKERLSLEAKLELIRALAASGLKRIEVGSFVRPDWIPQLADTDALVRRLLDSHLSETSEGSKDSEGSEPSEDSKLPPGLRLYALVPNRTGLARAIDCGLKDVAVFMSATESHNQKNTNKSMRESLEEFEKLIPMALAAGVQVRAYLSCIWGCPYEGKVDAKKALVVANRLLGFGASELSLGDTIGVGNPRQTREIVSLFLNGDAASPGIAAGKIALHMHDTHGTALANCLAAYEQGIRIFDASIGGTGGCPYAPGAAGNLATEDLASMFGEMGIDCGVELDKLFDAGEIAQRNIGHALSGRRLQAALGRRAKAPIPLAAT